MFMCVSCAFSLAFPSFVCLLVLFYSTFLKVSYLFSNEKKKRCGLDRWVEGKLIIIYLMKKLDYLYKSNSVLISSAL